MSYLSFCLVNANQTFVSHQTKTITCLVRTNAMRGPFVCWQEIIQPEERKKMILCVRNRIENDFKKMKQYYGNENYIQLFIEKRWERERERERSGLKIFLSDMSDHIWLLNTKWLKLNQRWKSLNAICGTWLNYHSNSRYDIHYILFLRTHIYFSMMLKGVLRITT